MPASLLRCLVAAAALGAAWSASADATCELPVSEENTLGDRAGLLARYERLPHACLREIVTTCTRESSRSLMDFGTAASCSLGYEALLRQGFGGNFHAMLAWWHSQNSASTP